MTRLLEVEALTTEFLTDAGESIRAVRGVDFAVDSGETLAILGESGSGKSVMSKALMGLVDFPGVVGGNVRFEGQELVGRSDRQMREIRGTGIGMVFQDSLDSLNPVYSVGAQLVEALRVRRYLDRTHARRQAVELMDRVGITDADERFGSYPHEFSGGMRQRICIALTVALGPRLLIADEPTTALDVTVQAGIIRLLKEIQTSTRMGMIFVTHDLAVARMIATHVIVMYQGSIVERGQIGSVFEAPEHPYTRRLLMSHPGAVKDWRELGRSAGEFRRGTSGGESR